MLLIMEELAAPGRLEVRVDGAKISNLDLFCADPVKMRFDITFLLPDSVTRGAHQIELRLGSRVFSPVGIEVA